MVQSLRNALVIFLFLAVSVNHLAKSTGEVCPKKCKCSTYFKTINCEHKELYDIPENIPVTATQLFLGYNNLAEIANGSFSTLMNLTELSLLNNKIGTLQNQSFLGLRKLKYLTMRKNKLTSISKEAFFDLVSLQKLFLTDNYLTLVPDLSFLPNLIYLAVDTNFLESANLCSGSTNLSRLSTIMLANNANLTRLALSDFECVNRQTVRSVDITRCSVQEFEEKIFSFPHLQALKISYNVIPYDMLSVLFSSIVPSDLTYLDLSGVLKPVQVLPPDLFRNLSGLKLKQLSLAHTLKVDDITNGTFQYLPYLEILDLSNSEFRQISDASFVQMRRLTRISLDNNRRLSDVPVINSSSLLLLSLKDNIQIEELPNYAFSGLPNLQNLTFHGCRIRTIRRHSFSGLQNLKLLNLSHNAIGGNSVPAKALSVLQSLEVLDLSFNKLTTISTEYTLFSGLYKLQKLDLSGNACGNISARIFQPLIKLQRLELAGNYLARAFQTDTGELFRGLEKLAYIGFENNGVYMLSERLFAGLSSLERVKLSNNILTSWPAKVFNDSDSLDLVDLASNKIATVTEAELSTLPGSARINLTGNPFACDCDLIWFRRWIDRDNSSKSRLVGLDSYTCNSPDKMAKKLVLDFNADEIEPSCRVLPLTWILVGTVGGVVALMFFTVGLVYRFRWQIRLHYFYAKRRLRAPNEPDWQNLQDNFEYDIYVSYGPSDRDRIWVQNELMPRFSRNDAYSESSEANRDDPMLTNADDTADGRDTQPLLSEDGASQDVAGPTASQDVAVPTSAAATDDIVAPYPVLGEWKVFIEEEGAAFGQLVFDTLAESIYKSRKVILVVSEEYLGDGRRRAEVELAARSRYENHQTFGSIIVVFLESDVDLKAPRILDSIVGDREHLSWVEDDAAGQELFWQQLAEAIKMQPDVALLSA